jgi:UDPglucose 6-dehydrogenase
MKISIFGTGYVGLVSGACLAEIGHDVVCVDVDPVKIANLNVGVLPIWEPGLDTLVERNFKDGRLRFSNDAALAVAQTIATHMTKYKVVVNKSTVPVGTADKVSAAISAVLAQRAGDAPAFDVVSNPEFLKEGAAVNDFLHPDRIVIGSASERAKGVMADVYEPFMRNHDRTIYMDVRSAELTKYAANALLATKISFMNEVANLAERLGADIEQVRKGIGSDPRIGYHFIYPGCGYGGSCFPKDVQALGRTAAQIGYDTPLLDAVEAVNKRQKTTLFTKLANHFGGAANLQGKTIAVWGLSFKPKTDDMREAPSRTLMEALWRVGARVQAFDPVAMPETGRIYPEHPMLALCPDKYAALTGADALVICTEWQQFRAPDFDEMELRMPGKLIIDGRNLYQPAKMQASGWNYLSVGRAPVLAESTLAA